MYICMYILKSYFSFIIGPVVYVLDLADRLISKACPFAAAGIMVGSIYWTAVTYGAVTVMQVHIDVFPLLTSFESQSSKEKSIKTPFSLA